MNKTFLLTIILLLNILSLSVLSQTAKYEQVKVMSYNIFHCEDEDGVIDLGNAARVIKAVNPDIVALQEVDRNTSRVEGKDLATELGYITHMLPVYGRAIDYNKGEYGVAILSKYNILKSQLYNLPHIENTEPRVALEILVQLNNKDTLRVVCTHLSHKSEELSLVQAKYIDNLFQDNIPSILAGDLNAIPASKTINYLKNNWTESIDDSLLTFPSSKAEIKIDYILTRPKSRWKIQESSVINEKGSSDHFPIIATLELKLLKRINPMELVK